MNFAEFESAIEAAREELQAEAIQAGGGPLPDNKVFTYLILKAQRQALGDLQFRLGRMEERLRNLEERAGNPGQPSEIRVEKT